MSKLILYLQGEKVEIEELWFVETKTRILLVRAPTAGEAARELRWAGFSEPLRIANYGFNLTQRGVAFSCVKDLVCEPEDRRAATKGGD